VSDAASCGGRLAGCLRAAELQTGRTEAPTQCAVRSTQNAVRCTLYGVPSRNLPDVPEPRRASFPPRARRDRPCSKKGKPLATVACSDTPTLSSSAAVSNIRRVRAINANTKKIKMLSMRCSALPAGVASSRFILAAMAAIMQGVYRPIQSTQSIQPPNNGGIRASSFLIMLPQADRTRQFCASGSCLCLAESVCCAHPNPYPSPPAIGLLFALQRVH